MLRRLALLVTLLVGSCTAAPAFAQDLPPVPSAIVSQLGPIPIRVVANLQCGGVPVYGCFDGLNRVIYLRDSMPVAVQWHTLMHEQVHVMLHDGGQTLMNPDGTRNKQLEERVADVIATARVNELVTLVRQLAVMQAAANRAAVEQAGAARADPAPSASAPPPAPER